MLKAKEVTYDRNIGLTINIISKMLAKIKRGSLHTQLQIILLEKLHKLQVLCILHKSVSKICNLLKGTKIT